MAETPIANTRALITLAVVCMLLFELGVLMVSWHYSLEGNGDFSAFYRTAVMARSGDLHSLYNPKKQLTFDSQVFPALRRFPPYYFYHPPYEVLVLLPLAFMSYRTAFWIWTGLSFLFLTVSAYVLEPEFREVRRTTGIPLAFFVLSSFPVMLIFLQGQDSPLLLLLHKLILPFLHLFGRNIFNMGSYPPLVAEFIFNAA